ncbi:KPN_02809 family neutral zinc metallopeptidase [Amycolatopsis nigrescens]|uniref:KPN_02809 family neutral zinc metallopeptidase n=1 Tax=Amycolatopsis nigrescens TaxID=381445 RepID=UPI00036C34E6|nr:neutral zinc metallopeptidase [Amycolatopsis nigrescens]
MRFNEDAGLDVSEVQDMRGVGGRVALGGGGLGVVGLVIYFLFSQFGAVDPGGGSGALGLGQVGSGQQVSNGSLAQECRTGADANRNHDCAVVATINSIQDYWGEQFARSGQTYQKAQTNFFNGGVRTGCGSASSDVGPFYCPADAEVYIDLAFFQQLRSQFGAQGGPFAEAYVLAHEYGHHVQNLLGNSAKAGQGSGPTSGSVRLELQADCYAGVWANHATTAASENGRPLITEVTDEDIKSALDTAAKIGDDYIQSELGGGRVDQSKFTHGTSKQREKWFSAGYSSGDPTRCDTFSARDLG